MKNIRTQLIQVSFITGMVFSFAAYAKDLNLKKGEYVLTVDAPIPTKKSGLELPRNWRTTFGGYHKQGSNPTRAGLDDLKASGSAEFTRKQFSNFVKKIKDKAKKILILDLRQESHALMGDLAVSWYGKDNTLNAGKTLAEIEADEASRLEQLRSMKQVPVKKWQYSEHPDGSKKAEFKDVLVPVEAVASEKEWVQENGAEYFRLPIPDHQRPRDEDVDQFLKKYQEWRSKDYWVHMHCAAGVGRTTTFMILYDMLKNCRSVSENDIIERQHLIGGANLLVVTATQGTRKEWAQSRKEFIHNFYTYCKEVGPEFKQSWSSWLHSSAH
jgi:protein-tyrosine phosphatase